MRFITAKMSDYLPTEILVEVLHRLNPESLVKCTCVCKSWKSLITHPDFISEHFARTLQRKQRNTGSFFIHLHRRQREAENRHYIYEEYYSVYSDNGQIGRLSKFTLNHLFQGKYLRTVGTCNGLVCLADYEATEGGTLIICNPSIRKYVVLPKPTLINCDHKRLRVVFGFGFDSRNHDFKLVRLVCFRRKQDDCRVLVYSLATNCWRSFTSRIPPSLASSHVWKSSQMCVNGVLHWVFNRRSDGGGVHNFILTFDLVEETFGELILPQLLKESALEVSILPGGDSLAVALRKESAEFEGSIFSIWVMKEYGVVESWTEVSHFDSRRFGDISRLLAVSSSGEVVLRSWSNGIIILDPVRESVKHLGLSGFFNAVVGYHVESLYLINKENVLSY